MVISHAEPALAACASDSGQVTPDPVHIAIVDDEPDLRQLARFLIDVDLAEVEHQITEVSDGRAAIDMCQRERVDVMVLDLHMPEVNGHSVLDGVSDSEGAPCVVAWSADEHALQVTADRGAHATAIKGTDGANLVVAVRSCLSPA